MLAKDLRQSLLQSAFEGKLVNQNCDDESVAKVLTIQQIESTEDYPYNIPDNWKWVRFGDISTYSKTKRKINAKDADKEIWMLDLEDIEKGGRLLCKKKASEKKAIGDKTVFNKGNILYSKLRPYLLKVLIADDDGICTPELVPFDMLCGINSRYVEYYLKSPYVDYEINKATYGVKMPRVGTDTMTNLCFPFPPIEEQERIVAKVDELMAKIDEYENIEKELSVLESSISTSMKESILQGAMQGKLTEQLDTDSKNKIKQENIEECYETYELPNGWQWNTIDSLVSVTTGLSFTKQEQCKESKDALRILRGGNILDNYTYGLFDNDVYVEYKDKYTELEVGDVISPSVTSMEKMCKVAYIDKKMNFVTAGGFVYIFRSKDKQILNPKYFMYFFSSDYNKTNCNINIHKSGQAFYNLKKSGMITQPVPLPPIEEQKRIVDKLDKLLPLCESLNLN